MTILCQSPKPTVVLSSRSFGVKADGAAVSRQVGIYVMNRRWFSFSR
jgi:hypothetical protein